MTCPISSSPGCPQHPPGNSPRERLLRAAVSVFNEKGYAATSVREICERAGVTKPVLYYHYRSKEGVFRAIMENALEFYALRLAEATAFEGSCRERVTHLFVTIFALYLEHMEIPQLMLSAFYGSHQGAPEFEMKEFHQLFEDAFNPILREGVEKGEFRDAPLPHLFAALAGGIHLAMDEQLQIDNRPPRIGRDDLRPMLDLIFSGISAPATAKETP